MKEYIENQTYLKKDDPELISKIAKYLIWVKQPENNKATDQIKDIGKTYTVDLNYQANQANGRECEVNEIMITNDESSNFINVTDTDSGVDNDTDKMDDNEDVDTTENAKLLSN